MKYPGELQLTTYSLTLFPLGSGVYVSASWSWVGPVNTLTNRITGKWKYELCKREEAQWRVTHKWRGTAVSAEFSWQQHGLAHHVRRASGRGSFIQYELLHQMQHEPSPLTCPSYKFMNEWMLFLFQATKVFVMVHYAAIVNWKSYIC